MTRRRSAHDELRNVIANRRIRVGLMADPPQTASQHSARAELLAELAALELELGELEASDDPPDRRRPDRPLHTPKLRGAL